VAELSMANTPDGPTGLVLHRIVVPAAWPVVLAWAHPVRALAGQRQILSASEHERSRRLRREADRARFETGRLLARTLLASQLGVAPEAVRIGVRPAVGSELEAPADFRRPVVEGTAAEGLRLSIAHAAQRVLVAVASGVDVGVDVEPTGELLSAELWASVCTEAEQAALTACAPEGREDAFIALWTRKEAVLKACGRGLTVPMTSLEIGDGDGAARVVVSAPPLPAAERFELADLDVGAGYRAALAVLRG
jgi:4'-phosphopantetheinyl transferase